MDSGDISVVKDNSERRAWASDSGDADLGRLAQVDRSTGGTLLRTAVVSNKSVDSERTINVQVVSGPLVVEGNGEDVGGNVTSDSSHVVTGSIGNWEGGLVAGEWGWDRELSVGTSVDTVSVLQVNSDGESVTLVGEKRVGGVVNNADTVNNLEVTEIGNSNLWNGLWRTVNNSSGGEWSA